jgi:hypothetical protein
LLRPGGRPQTGASARLDASLVMAVTRYSVTSQILLKFAQVMEMQGTVVELIFTQVS